MVVYENDLVVILLNLMGVLSDFLLVLRLIILGWYELFTFCI